MAEEKLFADILPLDYNGNKQSRFAICKFSQSLWHFAGIQYKKPQNFNR